MGPAGRPPTNTVQVLKLKVGHVREHPFGLTPPTFGHCPFGWVGLNACPDGLGHLLIEELSSPSEW